jgi:hypothetical protein
VPTAGSRYPLSSQLAVMATASTIAPPPSAGMQAPSTTRRLRSRSCQRGAQSCTASRPKHTPTCRHSDPSPAPRPCTGGLHTLLRSCGLPCLPACLPPARAQQPSRMVSIRVHCFRVLLAAGRTPTWAAAS